MSTSESGADAQTVKLGLLMETAQTQQQLADRSVARLEAHAQGLDRVVREQIQRTFVEECGALVEETRKATEALRHLQHSANRRLAWWSVAFTALCGGVVMLVTERVLPSEGELTALRAQRQQLATAIGQLADSGGRIELRRCGSTQRLCVRIDKQAPAFGATADYFIVKGY